MTVHQLRVYSLATAESASRYATIHWGRHLGSLPTFGIEPHGVWISREDPTKVFALVSYADGIEPAEADRGYMTSQAFLDDMAGFPMGDIRGVEATTLDPAETSPLR